MDYSSLQALWIFTALYQGTAFAVPNRPVLD